MRALLSAFALLTVLMGAEDEKPHVRVIFRALAFDAPLVGAGFVDGRNFRRLNITTDSFTSPQTYTGDPNITFVIAEDIVRKATSRPSQEMVAATQRLNRAQAVSAQASLEFGEISQILRKLGLQHSETAQGPSPGDKIQTAALESRQTELTLTLLAAAKESEIASLQILQLQTTQRHLAPPDAAAKASQKNRFASNGVLTPTASCTFPKDGNYLLLFSNTGRGHQILVIPDNDGAFDYGSLLFINLTGMELEIRDRGRAIHIPSNGRGTVPIAAGEGKQVTMEIYARTYEGWQPAYALRTMQHKDIRTLTFITRLEPEGHSVVLRGIDEHRPAEATTK